jgi:Tat protein secretion system quality control protein TatD with DNase activity
MLYDVHLHLDLFSDKEIKEIVKSQRVEFVIVNSVDLNSALKIIEINKKYPDFVKLLWVFILRCTFQGDKEHKKRFF